MGLDELLKERREYNKANSKFIILEEGESFVGVYQNAESGEDPKYGKRIYFKFKVDEMDKILNRSASGPTYRLLNQMREAGVKVGDKVKITRLKNKGNQHQFHVDNFNPPELERNNDTSPIEKIFGN